MQREIVKYPAEILSRVCQPAGITAMTLQLIADMVDTVEAHQGCGLAANQIGADSRVLVIDMSRVERTSELHAGSESQFVGRSCDLPQNWRRFALINPIVTVNPHSRRVKEREGCLSCPGPQLKITRRDQITVTGTRPDDGLKWSFVCSGWLSRVIQHEVDHLNGLSICNARPNV